MEHLFFKEWIFLKQKKSFLIYHDYWEWLRLLTNEELGRLMRIIFAYEREQILPENLDGKLEMAFAMIKETLDRDKKKYEIVCNRNREIARMRWEKLQDYGIDPTAEDLKYRADE
jgi:hypothetical protein